MQILNYCLTKQTSKAFVITLRGHAMLMQGLLDEGYCYIGTINAMCEIDI